MNLDVLIRDADPARSVSDSELTARAIRRGYRRARAANRRWIVASRAGAATAVTALATAAALLAAGGGAVTTSSAAAAVLNRAAEAAAMRAAVSLPSDSYLYSITTNLAGSYWQWGSVSSAAYTTQLETVQRWVGADGSDRTVVTYNGPQTFATPAGQAAWTAAGMPSITPTVNTESGEYETEDGAGTMIAPNDLSQLPTDPSALAAAINAGTTGLSEIGYQPRVATTPGYTFGTAASILATPALGTSPALRSALYQVMAAVPGVALLGPATDHSGRSGTAIAGPLDSGSTGGAGVPSGANGVRLEVIIDPETGAVLETSDVIANPTLDDALAQRVLGDTAGTTPSWTDYGSTGVVTSTADTPSATS